MSYFWLLRVVAVSLWCTGTSSSSSCSTRGAVVSSKFVYPLPLLPN